MRQTFARYSLLLVLLSNGCTKWEYWTSGKPEILRWRAPILGWDRMRSFSIARFRPGTTEQSVADSSVNSMAFALRARLEAEGYQYFEDPDSADFIAVVHGSNDAHGTLRWSEHDTSLTLTETVPVTLYHYRSFEGNSDPYVGYVLPRATTTPKAMIVVFNRRTRQPMLRWLEAGTVRETRFEVGEQHFMQDFVQSLSTSGTVPLNLFGSGRMGTSFYPWTPDGVNYWPRLGDFVKNTPITYTSARPGDLILEVNGQSLKNAPIRQVIEGLRGSAGDKKTLRLWRYWGQTFEISLNLAPR